MENAGDKIRKLLTLLITWALLLGFFFLFEVYFVAGQREFLVERQFRSLSALSSELQAEFERAQISAESSLRLVASASKEPATSGPLVDCQNASYMQRCFVNFTNIYLGDVLVHEPTPAPVPRCWGPDRSHIPLEMATEKGRLMLHVRCFLRQDPKQAGRPDPSSATEVFTLEMTPWNQRAFGHLADPFDDVLLTDGSGRVLFQRSATEAHIGDLSLILASSVELGPRQSIVAPPAAPRQDQSSAPKADQGASSSGLAELDQPPTQVAKLSVVRALRRAAIGGTSYDLFSEPTRLVLGNYPSAGGVWPLVLFGVRRTRSLDAESHALPYSTLIWVALSASVLFSLSCPLFKLRYMSNTERFSPRDGWYLILAFFLMSTAATVILLNASSLSEVRAADDLAMKALAEKIKKNFEDEVRRAFDQLRDIWHHPAFANSRKNPTTPALYGAYLSDAKVSLSYPYFEIAFWTNCTGDQLLKLDVR